MTATRRRPIAAGITAVVVAAWFAHTVSYSSSAPNPTGGHTDTSPSIAVPSHSNAPLWPASRPTGPLNEAQKEAAREVFARATAESLANPRRTTYPIDHFSSRPLKLDEEWTTCNGQKISGREGYPRRDGSCDQRFNCIEHSFDETDCAYLDECPDGLVPICTFKKEEPLGLICVPQALLGDGECQPVMFGCASHGYDRGDCRIQREDCDRGWLPGCVLDTPEGLVLPCVDPARLGDGRCDEDLACDELRLDRGDCPVEAVLPAFRD